MALSSSEVQYSDSFDEFSVNLLLKRIPNFSNALILLYNVDTKLVCNINWCYFCANLNKDYINNNGYKNN